MWYIILIIGWGMSATTTAYVLAIYDVQEGGAEYYMQLDILDCLGAGVITFLAWPIFAFNLFKRD